MFALNGSMVDMMFCDTFLAFQIHTIEGNIYQIFITLLYLDNYNSFCLIIFSTFRSNSFARSK